jgi:hypothetical protein
MADSGQRPTAGSVSSDVHTLVDDIMEMLSDMTMRKIDISTEQRYFNVLLHDMTTVPEEVSAERMRKVMARLQKKTVQISLQNDSNATAADKPDSSAPTLPTAAIGHRHGEVEGEQPGGVYPGAGAAAPTFSRGSRKAAPYMYPSLRSVCRFHGR